MKADERPSLDDDAFVDKAIAQVACALSINHKGQMTNCIEMLVRPQRLATDELGNHPGEEFVLASFTREEIREMLGWLDQDWASHLKHTQGDGSLRQRFIRLLRRLWPRKSGPC